MSTRSVAIASNSGATRRQGPHQAAQKSTTTGTSERSTSDSKRSRSSAWITADIAYSLLIGSGQPIQQIPLGVYSAQELSGQFHEHLLDHVEGIAGRLG